STECFPINLSWSVTCSGWFGAGYLNGCLPPRFRFSGWLSAPHPAKKRTPPWLPFVRRESPRVPGLPCSPELPPQTRRHPRPDVLASPLSTREWHPEPVGRTLSLPELLPGGHKDSSHPILS